MPSCHPHSEPSILESRYCQAQPKLSFSLASALAEISCILRIERVQKSALCIILGENYRSYRSALKQIQLESLFSSRNKLCRKFTQKSLKSSKFSKWFKGDDRRTSSRLVSPRFYDVVCRTERFRRSPISYLTDILNK